MSGYINILIVHSDKEINGVKKRRETVILLNPHTRACAKKHT
jgi:hypothetical protein